MRGRPLPLWLGTLCALSALAVLSCRAQNQQIHRHMSVEDLRRLFQVERHDDVPEYEVVRVTSRFPAKGDTTGGGAGDGGGGGGGDGRTSTMGSSTTSTSTAAPEEDGDVSRVVQLSAFGRQHELRLRPAEGLLKKDLRVFLAQQGNGTDVDYTEIHHDGEHVGEIFQDEASQAAILIHQDPDGSFLLEGTIGQDLVMKPVPASVRQHLDADDTSSSSRDPDDEMFLDQEDASADEVVQGFPLGKESNRDVRFEGSELVQGRRRLRRDAPHHAHIVFKRAGSSQAETPDLSDYAYMEPDAIPVRRSRSRRSITKREAPYVIYPEILVIVDYDGYRLHGGDNVQIKRYFVSFWNGVDLRYKLLKGPRIRISIAGIIISRGRDATPYLERNRVGRDAIDSAAALTDMGKYLFRERRLPVYDIAVAVTKYDMCRRRKGGRCTKGTAGFAYVGGACVVNKRLEKVNSVAIIEDTGGFSGIIVAAHEVGHLLGAVHDGSPPPSYLGGPGAEKCRWEDGYIMSDLRHTEKGFKWSPCTVASFHHFLNGDTATCLYNSPHEDESLPRVLPGKLLTLDAQCRKDRGTSACFKDDRVCAQLFCFDSGSGYCVAYRPAAEGSPCGDGQYCMNGKCVVEHENIIPDYSQNTPAFLRRIDDDGSRPYYTYNITTQRSEWADFWNERLNDITTIPSISSSTMQSNNHLTNDLYSTSPPDQTKKYHDYTSKQALKNSLGNSKAPVSEQLSSTTQHAYSPQLYNQNPVTESYISSQKSSDQTTKGVNFHTFYTYSTTKSPYDFSNFGKHNKETSTQSPTENSSKANLYEEFYRTSTTKQNLYEEYYRTSTVKQNLYEEYYRTSTLKQHQPFEDYYKTSTTPNPNVYDAYAFYKTSTARPNLYEEYYKTSTHKTTKNPYDFSNFGLQTTPTTTQNYQDYYKALQTSKNPYQEYELYYKTSTTERPDYQNSGTIEHESLTWTGNQPSAQPVHAILNPSPAPISLDHSTSMVVGTEDCKDTAQTISGGLSCREFLERFGFQYCNFQSMRKSCCASQRQVCPPSR